MATEQDFIGRTKKDAQNIAEKKNLIFHLVRIDGEAFFPYPNDSRTDRVCIEIDAGKVSKAIFC